MKAFEGRKFLTIIAGVVFAYLAFSRLVDPKDAMVIVTMVFVLYFNRPDRAKQEETK